MSTKAAKVKHRVTFAPETKTQTEQLDCLVRAIEFKGPGIDELSNMIQNIHIDDETGSKFKRRKSFDSNAIIEKLRNVLDGILDSELADTYIRNDNIVGDKETCSPAINPIKENNEKENKNRTPDSGVGDMGLDLEKVDKNEVTPQARKRASKLINKLDNCITELQKVTSTIEEETPSQIQALSNDNINISAQEAIPPRKKSLSRQSFIPLKNVQPIPIKNGQTVQIKNAQNVPIKNGQQVQIKNVRVYRHSVPHKSPSREVLPSNGKLYRHNSDDSNIYKKMYMNNQPNINSSGSGYSSDPVVAVSPRIYSPEPNNSYLYVQRMNNYNLNNNGVNRIDLIRKGIYNIPNQPTVMEANYSGYLLSSIFNVVTDECSILYYGILTGSNLYFYNSTDNDEPMFGRIIIDQNTQVARLLDDNRGFFIEIDGIYVTPDEQGINSKVRIMFKNKRERDIWYKVIKTTVNDWKIKASYAKKGVNSPNVKRRLSFLSSVQLQPYPVNTMSTPKRSSSINKDEHVKPLYKKPAELSEPAIFTPGSVDTMTNPNDLNITNLNDVNVFSPSSLASTVTGEENFGNVFPGQSILNAIHAFEAYNRKCNNINFKR